MTAHVPARQPFGVLDSPRLQNLASAKNRQNSLPASPFSFASPGKQLKFSPSKRRHAPASFDDDFDSENVDPALFDSPTKRSKASDGTPKKVSKFILSTDAVPTSSSSARYSTPLPSASQKPRTASAPNKPTISTSRGSPKHKRVGLLSKHRTSSSSITRIDPPAFGLSPRRSAGLSFSIDAALTGSIPSYAPSPKTAKPAASDLNIPTLDEAMPNSWFFEIHEDTPEQEATNMMEHSAYVLDISSDDDSDTKCRNEAREKGKENIPPPDFHLSTSSTSRSVDASGAEVGKPSRRRQQLDKDAMDEDRSPLSDLPASDYFGEGLDVNSHVVVDGTAPEKGSSLSKECTFDDDEPSEEQDKTTPAVSEPDLDAVVEPVGKAEKKPEPVEPEVAPSEESKDFVVYDENAGASEAKETDKSTVD